MPKIIDHDTRRGELLDGAFELFAERGFDALPMRRIASELRVSTGTLYHYFENKVAIFRAMYARRAARDVAEIDELVPAGTPPREAVAAIARFVTAHADDLQRSLLVALDFNRRPGAAVRQVIRENVAVYRGLIRDRFGLGSAAAASVVLSFLFGILVHRVLDPEAVDLTAQLTELAGVLESVGA